MRNFQYSAFPRLTPAVGNILFANIFFFILNWILGDRFDLSTLLGFSYPGSVNFHSWQIVTYMFMHAGIDHPEHILFNMFALYTFGIVLENVWGSQRFVYFYFICGIGAILLQAGIQAWEVYRITGTAFPSHSMLSEVDPFLLGKLQAIYNNPTVGASGAIFGLLLAFGMLFPNTELYLFFVPIPIKAKYLVSGYILLELYMGIKNNPGDNVAHFAHLGGALFGYLVLRFWNSRNYKRFY
jgi:rhomboid-like protein